MAGDNLSPHVVLEAGLELDELPDAARNGEVLRPAATRGDKAAQKHGQAPTPPDPPTAQPLDAQAAARQLLTFLSTRPAHPGHHAISQASSCSDTELADSCVVLEFDMLETADASPPLAQALAYDTEAVRQALMELLFTDDVLKARYPRLWIRLKSVPLLPEASVTASTAKLVASSGKVGRLPKPALTVTSSLWTPAPQEQGELIQLSGVITAITTPWRTKYAQTWCCRACGAETQCLASPFGRRPHPGGSGEGLAGGAVLQCSSCSMTAHVTGSGATDGQGGLREELSQRVMVSAQHLWLSDLSSAAGCSGAYAAVHDSMLVCLTDDLLAPSGVPLGVGDMVHVVGLARLVPAVATTAAAAVGAGYTGMAGQLAKAAGLVELAALYVSRSDATLRSRSAAFLPWRNGLALGQVPDDPVQLQDLCDALMDALGQAVSYPLCLALLISGVCVHHSSDPCAAPDRSGAGDTAAAGALQPHPMNPLSSSQQLNSQHRASKRSYDAKPLQQLSLLVVGDLQGSMLLPRVLRPAAHLLSPHSVFLGPLMEDALMPRLQPYARADQDGQEVQVIHSSALTSANYGIMVADALVLKSAKEKLQLAEALSRGHVVLGAKKAGGGGSLMVPVTATVWAAGEPAWSDAGGFDAGRGKKGAMGGDGALRHDGFNLVLMHAHEDDQAAEAAVMSAAVGGGRFSRGDGASEQQAGVGWNIRRPQGSQAADFLRQRMCTSRCRASAPRFTADAISMLQRYVVSVRQSGAGGLVPHAQIVTTLVAAARGCAALLGRSVVMSHPDCVVAILLMEATLLAKFGSLYFNGCLPCMTLRAEVELEEQLFRFFQMLDLQLQSVGPTTSFGPGGGWPSAAD